MRGSQRGCRTFGRATAPPVQAEEAEIPYSEQRLATEWSKACPEPKAGEETCELLRPPLEGDESEGPGSGPNGGLTPAELRSRYGLTNPAAGAGEEVAVINSGGYPHANQDLKLYREHYELSTCDEEDSCFRTVNGRGEEGKYPTTELRATEEDGLDLDMVSAACPACRILLVEAEPNKSPEAVEEAVRLGANVVTNSWTFGPEGGKGVTAEKEEEDEHYFEHPGVPIVFAAGDGKYGVRWPPASPHVISVGGTELRGGEEQVWNGKGGTGSGCSAYAPKPEFQRSKFFAKCSHRLDNDVSGPGQFVSTYDSENHENHEPKHWESASGTSAAAPFFAGTEALDSSFVRSLGAEFFYNDPGALRDVTKGDNGECSKESEELFWCNAEVGYDGPTGWGTPNGEITATSLEPAPITETATSGSGATETLTGSINPDNLETEYYFEYGRSGYESSTTHKTLPSGFHREAVSVTLTLESGEYQYRLVAKNSDNEVGRPTYGERETFTANTRMETLEPYSNGYDSEWKVSGTSYAWQAVKHKEKTESYISATGKGKTQSIRLGKENTEWKYKSGWKLKHISFKYISDAPAGAAEADIGAVGTLEDKDLPTTLTTEAFSPVGDLETAQKDWEAGGSYPFEVYFEQLKTESTASKVYAVWAEVEVEV